MVLDMGTRVLTRVPTGATCTPDEQAWGMSHADPGRGRHWYDLRPKPRRRTDLMGFNSTLWMAAVWVVVIALAVFPFPWWW